MTCWGTSKHFSESENFTVITFAQSRRNKGYMADERQEASGLKEVPSSEILSKIKKKANLLLNTIMSELQVISISAS